jgi:hypothetical protein
MRPSVKVQDPLTTLSQVVEMERQTTPMQTSMRPSASLVLRPTKRHQKTVLAGKKNHHQIVDIAIRLAGFVAEPSKSLL